MARQKLDPHDINRVKTQNPASLRSDCPACSGMRVQLGVESLSSFTGIRRVITDNDWQRPDLQEKYRGYFQYFLQEKTDRMGKA